MYEKKSLEKELSDYRREIREKVFEYERLIGVKTLEDEIARIKERLDTEKVKPQDTTPVGRMKYMDKVYWGMHDHWRNIAKPTIAMVQGYCIMGSWMLAAACDLIIVSEDVRFTDRLVRWGGCPP
ncbi:hypothetical protein ES703_111132 [subsurface metagenome]